MTPIDYIRVDADILLRQDLSSTEKLVLGLIKNFNSKGLRLSNGEIGRHIGSKPDTVTGIIRSLKDKHLIEIKNGQSRYRGIFYSALKSGVKSNSTPENNRATPDYNRVYSGEKSGHNRSNKKNKTPTPIGMELSSFLLDKILARKPDYRKPSIPAWAVHIDRMLSIDHRKPEIIRQVITWAQGDSFWQNNILSTETLRKQFDRLELGMNKVKPGQAEAPAYKPPTEPTPYQLEMQRIQKQGAIKNVKS